MTVYYPEGRLQDTAENRRAIADFNSLTEAMKKEQVLEAKAVLCDSGHNLHVDLGADRGIIPREEGALGNRQGNERDIALISRVNRPVCFTVQDLFWENGIPKALLSRRRAQEKCMAEYIDPLIPGDVIDARITHLEQFGAFADIGCGVISLIPIDSISVSRIAHPRERFSPDMDVRVVIKNRQDGKITLSQKELLGTWEENAARFSAGETVGGIIRSVESYGIFVELTPNLAGLAESKPGVRPGQQASVYIKSILPERMKIKLIIIDAFDTPSVCPAPHYYFTGSHMDSFVYSPAASVKQIVHNFQ